MTATHETVCLIQLRTADMSGGGHIGNANVVEIVDEARLRFLGVPPAAYPPDADGDGAVLRGLDRTVGTLVAQQTFEYAGELWFRPAPLAVRLWITGLGRTSVRVAATVHQDQHPDTPAAVRSEATIVLLDGPGGAPWPITDAARERLSRHVGPEMRFRGRVLSA